MSATPPDTEIVLAIRVVPRSPRTRVDGRRGDAILIRVPAPPVDGAANDALIAFLADTLRLPRRAIRIVAGERSRDKTIAIAGISINAVHAALGLQ